MTRISLSTFGCKANQGDTDALREGLAAELDGRADFVAGGEHADVVLINTCTVTHTADADARQLIRRRRRENPNALIVVTGCYAQVSSETVNAMEEVDLVVGNIHKSRLPAMVGQWARGDAINADFKRYGHRDWSPSLRDATAIRTLPEGRSRPFVKVQDGCDYVCSFCIIPTARGESRSIPMDEVVATVNRYAEAGAREVVLTGIHLGHWGRDIKPKRRFGDMLEELLERTHSVRFRVSSLEPNEVDKKVLDLVSGSERVCPHLHVPLQSGDNHILAQMRRVYRTPWYRKIAEEFKSRAPHGAWGIDVMVGFPGEDEKAFEQSYEFLTGIPFTYLHVFPYSQRRGTQAATMPEQVQPQVKQARSRRLIELSNRRRDQHTERVLGRKLQVLVERRRIKGRLRGYSECYVPVVLDGSDSLMNQLVRVQIIEVNDGVARGQICG
jgi:threonylcarbamoyladenosine tRNA methylthiotransferase MtaB